MAPFFPPRVVVIGFKEKIESLTVQGDILYIGTSTGNLHIYSIDDSLNEGDPIVSLVEIKKGLARRAIEQLGFIKDINSLVVLSEASVTLFPLPTLSPPTPLTGAKAAFSFATHTFVEHILPGGKVEELSDVGFTKTKAIPTLVTQLIVGCRRKLVIYSWRDGEAQEAKEVPLPHSPRVISFMNPETLCFAYSPSEFAVFSIPTLSASEVSIPLPITASTVGMGAFTGLTGYMSLGLGAKAKPAVVQINDSDTLIVKDNEGIFIGADGKPSRTASIEWPAPPEEIAFVKPYIFSVLPPGTVQTPDAEASQPHLAATTVVQIRSSISLLPTQTLPFPFNASSPATSPALPHALNSTVRLMTPAPHAKSPLFLVTTPTDRTAASADGSSIWQFCMKSWPEQIDELVQAGQYADALALLDTIDQPMLADKDQRRVLIRTLNAVAQFRASQYKAAVDTFIELDINPAKVVALCPEIVAGRYAVHQEGWIPLFGGPPPTPVEDSASDTSRESSKDKGSQERPVTDLLDSLPIPSGINAGTIRGRFRTGLGVLMASTTGKDDDAASVHSAQPKKGIDEDLHRSIEALVIYLTDRRPKLAAALAAVNITPANQSHEIAPLSETSLDDLYAMPNAPLSALTPEQLLRYAQIVDTVLFKSYLLIRPGLLGSLCRVANWCEVSEIEEELRARKKFGELKDLYNEKKMHTKALDLLRQLSEKEEDPKDRLIPSISYLQKLGPEYLDQIFEASRWIFEQDRDMAFEIFTSEDVELPRHKVADYLEKIDPTLCARYLEYLLEERQENSTDSHDRLAELYLKMTLAAKKRGDERSRKEVYEKLLQFIDTTNDYRVDRLYGLMSSEDLYEGRAILLGRLGRHDQALELYVYRLQDYMKAEEYCKRYYRQDTDTKNIFLTLLRIYLRPTTKTTTDLLSPALELISRHSPRLDSVETLQLLPPLVTAEDIRTFLVEALRAPIFDTRVVRQISKARDDQLSRRLMLLQSKRVKVTDSRICPQCHKRLGNSVIVVHSPRGEVTHYQCRETFSRRLNETRR